MEAKKVKDLMIPVQTYATVHMDVTLLDAILTLDKSQEKIKGEIQRLPPKCIERMQHNDAIYYYVQGGGGWGDPLDRKPDDVARDFRNGLVSPGHARDAYGVVLDTERCEAHVRETENLRKRMRAERLK